MMARGLGQFTAQAVVPEQLSVYVAALSGRTALACGSCIAYVGDRDLVLVGYPPHDPHDLAAVDEAIVRARRLPVLARGGRLTVLCPARPHTVPDHATVREDCWFGIELPVPPPKQKLRNMLRRGQRAVRIDQNSKNFSAAHQALVEEHIRRHSLAPDLAGIYARLPAFLAASPQAVLFSAYSLDDHALVACAVGEYAGLHTAFYLFAFRS
ncbi:MAG: translation initiation factor IF-2, partial [Proteobacteria bacterium]|nr:translation initiation factor IF-2 [Pseudomonadota bacterium]